MKRPTTWAFWGIVGVLLVVAIGLILRIGSMTLDNDEIWNIWQTFGTPQQVINWTSGSEYPTFMLLLGFWKDIAGLYPFILHYFIVLLSLPAIAFMYRAARQLDGNWAGILAALTYAAFPISMFMSLQTRSYVIVYTTLPLALWLSSRYFERPTFKRGVLLGIVLYTMYIGNVSIVPALGLFALYLLMVYPKRILYGLFPAVIGLFLVLPDYLSNKLPLVNQVSGINQTRYAFPLPQAWFDFFNFYTITPVWYILFMIAVGAAIFVVWRRASQLRQYKRLLFWLAWLILVPLILYILEPRLGFYPPRRYGWWYVFGLALLIGMAFTHLPRFGRWVAAGVLVVLAFTPFSFFNYNFIVTPLGENMNWLRDHMQADDVLMVDPAITCNWPEEWDYYTRVYFPQGLRYVTTPEGTPRVWYLASQNEASREVEKELAQTRMAGRFVGPPGCFFRLYEGAPDSEGILFENGLRFHGFQIMSGDKPLNSPLVFHESEPIHVRLWWSVDETATLDYSVNLSLRLRDSTTVQSDSAPQVIYPEGAPTETSRWTPGQLYVEERTLTLPPSNYRRVFDLSLVVYWFGEPEHRFSAPGVSDDGSLPLTKITLVAW